MTSKIRLDGGPAAGLIDCQGPMGGQIALPVDETFRATSSPDFKAIAIYTRTAAEGDLTYAFQGFQGKDGGALAIEYLDGPLGGVREQPFLAMEVTVCLADGGSLYEGRGNPAAVAAYRLTEEAGKRRYVLAGVDASPETVRAATAAIREQKLAVAIRNFYVSPDYSIYTMKPTGQHAQVPLEVGWRRGHVDEAIAPVVAELWRIGFDTYGSCQERPAGADFAGKAYVAFARRTDAHHLHQLLAEAGILSSFVEKTLKAAHRDTPDGPNTETVEFDAGNVLFDPSDIGRIATHLAKISPVRG